MKTMSSEKRLYWKFELYDNVSALLVYTKRQI